MARLYLNEMEELADTLSAMAETDISSLQAAIRDIWGVPLCAIGSGGSLSAAHAMVRLHRRFTGRSAFASTPFDVLSEPLQRDAAAWLISAGGRNHDALSAARTLQSRDPLHLGVLTAKPKSPLTDLFEINAPSNVHVFKPPKGKDGFLATNSLLAFVLVLTRAYGSISDLSVENDQLFRASGVALRDRAWRDHLCAKVELPRFCGQFRAVTSSPELGDSRWT